MRCPARDYNEIDWKNLVYYDDTSPTFIKWKDSDIIPKTSRVKPNGKAGHINKLGYGAIVFRGNKYLIHRVIWILYNGSIDSCLVIDHIDGNPSNNNISNLRLVTTRLNMQNKKLHKNNSTGVVGVYYKDKDNAFSAEWYDLDGNRYTKQFGCNKYGYDIAFNLAKDLRAKMTRHYNNLGACYNTRAKECSGIT